MIVKEKLNVDYTIDLKLKVDLFVDESERQTLLGVIPVLFTEDSPYRKHASESAARAFVDGLVRHLQQVCPSVHAEAP